MNRNNRSPSDRMISPPEHQSERLACEHKRPSSVPLLRAINISKRFLGVLALQQVSFTVHSGEVHALLGENGAGKSTLLKILAGAHAQDSGVLKFEGQPLGFHTPADRQRQGIVTVYQEFNLMPNMSIAENVLIGREPGPGYFVDWRAMRRAAISATSRLDLNVDPATPVSALSVAEQQLVEIARALTLDAKLIILDEPTAALSDREVQKLHAVVRDLKSHGISVIYVSHRLVEVPQICDRYTVLRDGRLVGTGDVAKTSPEDLVRMMVGRNVDVHRSAATSQTSRVVLKVEHLSRTKKLPSPQAVMLRDLSFEVRGGEILGLAGLVGAGRTDLVRAIYGAEQFESGKIYLEGKPVKIDSPGKAIDVGMALVPEDRKQHALFLTQSVRRNLTLPSLKRLCRFGYFVDPNAESALIRRFKQNLRIRMANEDVIVGTLSGGNQQKVVLARYLALKPKILLVDEPTRGIDVGAKAEVHELLRELAAAGTAIVVVSSELPEIISLCDRIITVKEGRFTGEMAAADATEEKLMKLMTLGAGETHVHAPIN
jgi:inositol transport system ATP-binding protein